MFGHAPLPRPGQSRDAAALDPRIPGTGGAADTSRPGADDDHGSAVFSLHTAEDFGDQRGDGRALATSGVALRDVRRLEEAITAYAQAARIYRKIGE
ncbi:hypothetical protein DQ384_39780 [Sphaerisporangium album]|uniref:Tetratricopeptide repeat protein n=2 Tax=Sphaerisporangium album TaxID=509200 RepID=A0A367EJ84_9ACTN|nr:hypothetical protein DQ384_39780 [Sphaerisporangium album]